MHKVIEKTKRLKQSFEKSYSVSILMILWKKLT